MKKYLWIVYVAVAVVLIVGAVLLYNNLSKGYAPEQLVTEDEGTDNTAPDFTVYDANGNAVSLSDMKGKPVVVNFWASWCPPCKAELPDFDKSCLEHEGEVVFMMVNMTDGIQETLDAAQSYLAGTSFTFPVYFDSDLSAAYAYGVSSIPMTLFINAKGELVTFARGRIDADTLEKGIGMIK